MIAITVYKNCNNSHSIGLKASGDYQDISNSTRITLRLGNFLLDSNIHTTSFDYTTNGEDGQLDLALGRENGLPLGTFKALLTIYDATYPYGLPWGHLIVNVEDAACPTS